MNCPKAVEKILVAVW